MSTPISFTHYKNPSFFEVTYNDKFKKDVYKLNPEKLSKNECHMFFPINPCEELLIATLLEFMTFNPLNKEMNDKYNFNIVTCDQISLFWVSIPIEFKDVCERAGKIFGMTMKIMSRLMVSGAAGQMETIVDFPKHEKILNFEGPRCNNESEIEARCK